MKVLVASVDSDIGAAVADIHINKGDEVVGTSRNRKTQHHLELSHPFGWPRFDGEKFDIVYYTIGMGDGRNSRIEVMQTNCFASCDFLNLIAARVNNGGQIVVLTSEWGSISRCNNTRAPAYRMSKAAFNMGVAILKERHTHLRWTLMHPGLVDTKMTQNIHNAETITVVESAEGVVASAAKVSLPFTFIDYLGNTVEF